MVVKDLFSLAGVIVVGSFIVVGIVRGTNTAKIIGSTTDGFAKVIGQATQAGQPSQ